MEELQAVPMARQSPQVLAALDRHTSGAQQVDVPANASDVQPWVAVLQHFPPTHALLAQSEASMQLALAGWGVA
jgi:hypothetical protein